MPEYEVKRIVVTRETYLVSAETWQDALVETLPGGDPTEADVVDDEIESVVNMDDGQDWLDCPNEWDTTSSASRQHYIDTGSYLHPGEAIEAGEAHASRHCLAADAPNGNERWS